MKKSFSGGLVILMLLVGCKKNEPTAPPTAPQARIVSPVNYSQVLDSVVVIVEATDDKGVIKVEFYIDNVVDSARTFVVPPYAYIWRVEALPDSSVHTIYAKAYDGDGNATSTQVITVVVNRFRPTNLVVVRVTESVATLSWIDNSNIEDSFEVEQSLDGQNFNIVQIVNGSFTSTLVPGPFLQSTSYYFRLRARSGSRTSGYSNRVRIYGAREIFVGGNFSAAGGVASPNIARWDGTNWSDVGAGLNGPVRALEVVDDGLYVGGAFNMAGGVGGVQFVAKWDGTRWDSLGAGMDAQVYGLARNGSRLYAVGRFTRAGSTAAHGIAQWDGNSWAPLSSGVSGGSPDSYVNCVLVSGSSVYIGGNFTNAGGSSAQNIARWDGGAWTALGAGMGNQVEALEIYGNQLYAGGTFTTAGGNAARYVARWDGLQWNPVGTSLSIENPWVGCLATFNNELYVGGHFTVVEGMAATRIARWNGVQWLTVGSGFNGGVNALRTIRNELYAGGFFTMSGGLSVNRVAKWGGMSWTALGSGTDESVWAITEYDNWTWDNH